MRIETGYGLEGILTDAICYQIIQDILIPSFKAGQYSSGIYEGVLAVTSVIAQEYNVKISGQPSHFLERAGGKKKPFNSILELILTVLFFLFIINTLRELYRAPGNGYRRGGYWYGGGWGGGGGGFGGGLGGGFGGFGGGLSGGGGASGRW